MNYSLQNVEKIFHKPTCIGLLYPYEDGNNIPHFPEMFKLFFTKSVRNVKLSL